MFSPFFSHWERRKTAVFRFWSKILSCCPSRIFYFIQWWERLQKTPLIIVCQNKMCKLMPRFHRPFSVKRMISAFTGWHLSWALPHDSFTNQSEQVSCIFNQSGAKWKPKYAWFSCPFKKLSVKFLALKSTERKSASDDPFNQWISSSRKSVLCVAFFYNSSEGLNVKYKIYLTGLSILWMKLRFRMGCKIPVLCQVLLLHILQNYETNVHYSDLLLVFLALAYYFVLLDLRLVVTSDWIGVVIVIRSVECYDLVKTAFLCGLWLRRLCCSETIGSPSRKEKQKN